jgi:hypothetical protein
MGDFPFFLFPFVTSLGITKSGKGTLDDLRSILGRRSAGPTARR